MLFDELFQTAATGPLAHVTLGGFSQREHDFGQLRLVQPGEKVGLVFGRIRAAQQSESVRRSIMDDTRIVAGGKTVEPDALLPGARKQKAEFHLRVAEGAGVWREPREMLAPEVVQHPVLVLINKGDRVVRNAEVFRRFAGGFDILGLAGTVSGTFLRGRNGQRGIPDTHCQPEHVVSLIYQAWNRTAESKPPLIPTATVVFSGVCVFHNHLVRL